MDSGLVVPDNNGDREGLSRFVDQHFPLRELESFDPEGCKIMVDLFSSMAGNLIGNFIKEDWTASDWYISDVITFGDDRERDILHLYLLDKGAAFRRKMFGFSFESDHVHVIHSCSFSSNQCKCSWRKKIPCGELRRGYRFRSQLSKWRARDFINVFLYMFFKKQTRDSRQEIWRNGTSEGLRANRTSCEWEKVEEAWGPILRSLREKSGCDLPIDRRTSEGPRDLYGENQGSQQGDWRSQETGSQGSSKTVPKFQLQTKWQRVSSKVSTLLEKYAICPLEGIKSEPEFLRDDFLTDPDTFEDLLALQMPLNQ